jgi:ABC-type antimicrobial peptide transport system permease subunit
MGKVLWPGDNPIGKCIQVQTKDCAYVVGIAENIKDRSLDADPGFYYYVSAAQFARRSGLFVRVHGPSGTKAREAVRARLQREMPGASYITITPMTDIIGAQTRSWHLGATMFVVFGALALVLAAVGLYSVIAYNVAQRTHELAVRVALGAEASNIVRLVVGEGFRIAIIGVVAGTLVAFFVARWVKPLLFNVSPRDPTVFVTVAAVLIGVALLASAIPALRASRADPNDALRAE